MATTLGVQLSMLSHRPQRQVLVEVFNQNPRDDMPPDNDNEEMAFEDEELEILLDYQHFHLPALESEGFIDYDRENHTVTKGPHFNEIEPLIRLIVDHEDELPDDWL